MKNIRFDDYWPLEHYEKDRIQFAKSVIKKELLDIGCQNLQFCLDQSRINSELCFSFVYNQKQFAGVIYFEISLKYSSDARDQDVRFYLLPHPIDMDKGDWIDPESWGFTLINYQDNIGVRFMKKVDLNKTTKLYEQLKSVFINQ